MQVPIGGCYRLIDVPMSNCINSGIRKIFILTQFNSFSLNRHLAKTYNFGNGMSFGDGFVEVLAATQTPGEAGKKWFQGTADAVRQFIWLFEDAKNKNVENILILSGDHLYRMDYMDFVQKHVDTNADITVSCIPMDDSRASDYGLMKIDETGRIVHFAEKPKGNLLKSMVNTHKTDLSKFLKIQRDPFGNLLKSNPPRGLTLDHEKAAPFDFFIGHATIFLFYLLYINFLMFHFQQVDTTLLGLSDYEALQNPYIASMGVYVFKTDVLLELLKWKYPSCNDFGSEIIPYALAEHNVQAYLFKDYWEDIGTIKSFFDANLALTEQPPKFDFNDPKTPFFTSPRFLPPTKVERCRIIDAIISHGCFLRECSVEHSVVGIRSRLDQGVELKDTMMMGADYYQTDSEIAALVATGRVPIGVGPNTKITNCIIDKNARIGRDVVIKNKDNVEEADRSDEGFYIRSGITVIIKNATIKDGTVV
ncbi:putative glucose-1-phosphate adenylyltransferase [Helianthus annuus]|nr:putative glucose-1-phosphate adenylyltransferase [Helianthus annuus]